MKNIYYLIWADAITSFRKHHPDRKDWKWALFFFLTWIMALNLFIILLWLKYFEIIIIPKFSIDIFPGKLLDGFITFTIEFALPFVPINYFLIFYKNRYIKIIQRYKDIRFRYAPIYSYTMALLALVSFVLYDVLT